MKLTPQARRLSLLGTALALTVTAAGWLFFGTHEETAPVTETGRRAAVPAPDTARPVAGVPDSAAVPRTGSTTALAAAPVRTRGARRDTVPATVTIEREVFAYGSGGRRDPFQSLISTSVLRPLLSELRLVAVAYDPNGAGSVAILRDLTTTDQHRVRVGQLLGRMRVARIRPRDVVFTIEELGYSRQEILGLQDSTAKRLP